VYLFFDFFSDEIGSKGGNARGPSITTIVIARKNSENVGGNQV
jgi:hypothetical protein